MRFLTLVLETSVNIEICIDFSKYRKIILRAHLSHVAFNF